MGGREDLWRRLAGAEAWPLAWALALACALPWCLPEAGPPPGPYGAVLAWLPVVLLAPLLLRRAWAGLVAGLALVAWTFGSLGGLARQEACLPTGFLDLEGRLCAPWTLQGELRQSLLRVNSPRSLEGLELPLSLPARGIAPPPPGTPLRFRGEVRAVEPGPVFLAERPLWRARSEGRPRRIVLPSALVMEVLGPPRPSLLLRWRCLVRERFQALDLPPGRARELWGALTLGIPPEHAETFEPFVESGTLHVLIVSGLQVTLVMGAAEALWRRLRGPGATWAALGTGFLYAMAVGLSAPVWRGFLMGAAWALGRGSGWKLPPALGLHGALALWLLAHPGSGCDPGFLLSWAALLGLLGCAEPLEGLLGPLAALGGPWLRKGLRLLVRSLAPWLSTLPVLALLQGGVPLWGPLLNLLMLPLVALLTPLCLFLEGLPLPGLVGATHALLGLMGKDLVPAFAQVSPLATGRLWPWLLLLAGWLLLAHRQATFRRCRGLCALLCGASLLLILGRGTGREVQGLSLEAIDIGQGDALLVRVPGAPATLVDTGPDAWGARRIVRVLSRRGVREPLHLMITHPHQDHAGGWATLARLWPLADTALPLQAEEAPWPTAPPRARSPQRLGRGDGWRRGEAAFSLRWPPAPMRPPDLNALSLVLRVRWRDRELWLMGDALEMQERDLLELGDPGGGEGLHRLLKAGHHGSSGASCAPWLEALRPELAVVTAGRRNRFDFPHEACVERLTEACGRDPLVCGPSLGVRVEALPGAWAVETGRGQAWRIPLGPPREMAGKCR